MQNCVLLPHPATPCKAVERIEASVRVDEGAALVRFRIVGEMGRVVLPPPEQPKRRDELWRRTCCELFVNASESADYYEFNFAPSTAWAAYRFSGYRTGMTPAEISGPEVAMELRRDSLELSATVRLRECPGLKGDFRAALACVIEERGNKFSYWALAHPADKPDFHHQDGFKLVLI
jgi:hypothetical protein